MLIVVVVEEEEEEEAEFISIEERMEPKFLTNSEPISFIS